MDGLKEILETLGSRIKSQIVGSIFLTFFLCNWKPLIYLLFSEKILEDRFKYFDLETSPESLLTLPIIIGFCLSLIFPWLAFFGAWLSEVPVRKKKILQVTSANKILILKQEFEQNRKKLQATTEEILIDQAKRDQEVASIEDKDERQKLQSQLDAIREKFDAQVNETQKPHDSITELEVITKRINILREQKQDFESNSEWDAAKIIDKAILSEVAKLNIQEFQPLT